MFVTTVLIDQLSKWWAWRHLSTAWIDSGGGILAPETIGAWYDNPRSGAVLDVADCVVLTGALYLLGVRRRSGGVLMGGGLVIAGLFGNLLDRLWLHRWTAPGSVRGAVDFIPVKTLNMFSTADLCFANIADVFIASGVVVSIIAAVRCCRRRDPIRRGLASPMTPRRTGVGRRFLLVLAALSTITALAVDGAANYGGTRQPAVAADPCDCARYPVEGPAIS